MIEGTVGKARGGEDGGVGCMNGARGNGVRLATKSFRVSNCCGSKVYFIK